MTRSRDALGEKLAILGDRRLIEVLAHLHEQANGQSGRLVGRLAVHLPRILLGRKLPWERLGPSLSSFYLAVDPDNGLLCYLLLRALRARRVVEVGTSMGVSTLYLAAAVRDNGGGTVIATEIVPEKAARARQSLGDAGLLDFVDLRVGDALCTLAAETDAIDFVLNDGFPPLALPVLERLAPLMRPGAIALCGNAALFPADHAEYVSWVRDPSNGFASLRLPMRFAGEMSVKNAGAREA